LAAFAAVVVVLVIFYGAFICKLLSRP